MDGTRSDLPRTTLAVLFIVGLIAAAFWVVRPFVAATIWATMIVVATWPLMLRIEQRLWRRRWVAVIVMTIAMLLVFAIPLSLALGAIVSNADDIVGWAQSLGTLKLPAPPDWVQTLPLIGDKAASTWRDLAASGPEELAQRVAPYMRDVARWFVAEIGNVGVIALQCLVTVVIASILFAHGEAAAELVRGVGRRLAGSEGERVVLLAAQAIRGVALGIVVTAVAQAALAGVGLAVAGVPLAPVLTAIMFILCLAQIGAMPVLLGAIAWLYWKDETGWAIALLVWSVPVVSLDNVLRPILIRMGADLPLLLIFAGVIGGLIAFGLVGIFIGPVVLAVVYTLLEAWVAQHPTRLE